MHRTPNPRGLDLQAARRFCLSELAISDLHALGLEEFELSVCIRVTPRLGFLLQHRPQSCFDLAVLEPVAARLQFCRNDALAA
jgi:hypothetical protein